MLKYKKGESCPKCGGNHFGPNVSWDKYRDIVWLSCDRCGCSWERLPLDAVIEKPDFSIPFQAIVTELLSMVKGKKK
jgi:transcription elongation factor Elf1